jgi:hypothetical protein
MFVIVTIHKAWLMIDKRRCTLSSSLLPKHVGTHKVGRHITTNDARYPQFTAECSHQTSGCCFRILSLNPNYVVDYSLRFCLDKLHIRATRVSSKSANLIELPHNIHYTPAMSSQSNSYALPLQGKVAIVTGASRGIGAGLAVELAKRGAKVSRASPTIHNRPLMYNRSHSCIPLPRVEN